MLQFQIASQNNLYSRLSVIKNNGVRMSEDFPISKKLKVMEGKTLYKTEKWWSAVVLLESFGRKQVAVYLWDKRNDQWKRRQKFVVKNKEEWQRLKDAIEEILQHI